MKVIDAANTLKIVLRGQYIQPAVDSKNYQVCPLP